MHKIWPIPQNIVDRVSKRDGGTHTYAKINPKKTALIAIDLQNCFLSTDLASVYVPGAVDIIPNVNRIADAVRESGGKVFWMHNTADGNTIQTWYSWFGIMKGGKDQIEHHIKNMSIGSKGYELHPSLIVKKEDLSVTKNRFSAFIQGASDLDKKLKAEDIDTLIIVGTLTNVCCESTARDAMMLNYKVIMVSDACAAVTDEEHNASLLNVFTTFGDIMTTDFLIEHLKIAQKQLV